MFSGFFSELYSNSYETLWFLCHQTYSEVCVKILLPLLKEIRKKLAPYIMIHFTLKSVKFYWLKWNNLVSGKILDGAYSFWYQHRKIRWQRILKHELKGLWWELGFRWPKEKVYDRGVCSSSRVSRLPSKSMKRRELGTSRLKFIASF